MRYKILSVALSLMVASSFVLCSASSNDSNGKEDLNPGSFSSLGSYLNVNDESSENKKIRLMLASEGKKQALESIFKCYKTKAGEDDPLGILRDLAEYFFMKMLLHQKYDLQEKDFKDDLPQFSSASQLLNDDPVAILLSSKTMKEISTCLEPSIHNSNDFDFTSLIQWLKKTVLVLQKRARDRLWNQFLQGALRHYATNPSNGESKWHSVFIKVREELSSLANRNDLLPGGLSEESLKALLIEAKTIKGTICKKLGHNSIGFPTPFIEESRDYWLLANCAIDLMKTLQDYRKREKILKKALQDKPVEINVKTNDQLPLAIFEAEDVENNKTLNHVQNEIDQLTQRLEDVQDLIKLLALIENHIVEAIKC